MSKQNDGQPQAGNVKTDGAAFLTALATALWEIHKARRIARSVGVVLAHFGIEVPEDTATNADAPTFKLPATGPSDDETVGSYSGVQFRDLNEDAKAKRRAQYVKDLRRQAYDFLRGQVEDIGRYNVAEVTRHFGKLGFPMPDTQTNISGMIRQGDHWEAISATVPGTVTEDEAKDAMRPLASHSPGHILSEQAFPARTDTESLLREVYVYTQSVWQSDPDA